MVTGELIDGFDGLLGVSGARATDVPRNFAANAGNRFFRYGENATRLPIHHIQLVYPEDTNNAQRFLFEGGNHQGHFFYNSYPSGLNTWLIASVSGTIFKIRIIGSTGYVTKLFDGNEPVFTHAWFVQAFNWLIIQDGVSQPILWDGTAPARRAFRNPDGTSEEVPVGSVMAFDQGYLCVASSDGTNQIAIGDQVFSNMADTSDVIRFTNQGPGRGPFGASIFIGDITGLFTMPYLDTGTGQNELVILGTEGGAAMDLSGLRDSWPDINLIRIVIIGSGCVSSHSLCAFNGDLLYRSVEGIRSYRNTRQEFQSTWRQTPISTDVRRWIASDAPRLLQFNSQTTWNNLLFSTCSPMIKRANNRFAGHHRFHRGFVVLDAEPESDTLRQGATIWQGAWTGIRPISFIEGRIENTHRCFAFSYDRDGVNRLYEIKKEGTNDWFMGTKRKIVSFFDSPSLGVVERTTNNFEQKNITGGNIELAGLPERVVFTTSIRPDNSPCFVDLEDDFAGCDCPTPDIPAPVIVPVPPAMNPVSPVVFTATSCTNPICEDIEFPEICETRTSAISQEDADALALAAVTVAAEEFCEDPPIDPDAETYFTSVPACGGTIDNPVARGAVNAWFIAAKTHSYYAKIKRLNLFCGDQLNGSLKPQIGILGFACDANFNFVDADYSLATGLKGNGSNKYLRTGANIWPGQSYNVALGVYNRSSVAAEGGLMIGAGSGSFRTSLQAPGSDGVARSEQYEVGVDIVSASPATPYGMIMGSRTSNVSHKLFRNGIEIASSASLTNAFVVNLDKPFYVFALNDNSAPIALVAATLGGYVIAEGFTGAEALDFYTDFQAAMTTLGRAV